jgi:hypothetical protein
MESILRVKRFNLLQKHYSEFSKKVYPNKTNTNRLKIHNDLYKKIEKQIENKDYPIINKTLLKYLEEILNMNGEYDILYKKFKKHKLAEQRANNINITNRKTINNIKNHMQLNNRGVKTDFFNNQTVLITNFINLNRNDGIRFFKHEYKIIFQDVTNKFSEFVNLVSENPQPMNKIHKAKEYIIYNQKFLKRIIDLNKEYLKFQQINKNLGNNTNVRTVQG